MGTEVTSPGTKAQDKEKVQEILKVSWYLFYQVFSLHQILRQMFSFEANGKLVKSKCCIGH